MSHWNWSKERHVGGYGILVEFVVLYVKYRRGFLMSLFIEAGVYRGRYHCGGWARQVDDRAVIA